MCQVGCKALLTQLNSTEVVEVLTTHFTESQLQSSVIFVNENGNGVKQENYKFVNEN